MLDKKLFVKPLWLQPEVNILRYWLHLGVISFVVLGVLELFLGLQMFDFFNWAVAVFLIGFGDVISHTVLRLG